MKEDLITISITYQLRYIDFCMRAIFIFFILSTLLMAGCASIEVAKEVTKVKQSVEMSIKKILRTPDEEKKEQEILVEEQEISTDEEREQIILVEEQKISQEQKIVSDVVKKQKNISTINLFGKTMNELDRLLGKPFLIREDGKTITARFDSKNCKLFVFMNTTINTPSIEYYELRNNKGELIKQQKDIELCFNEIKPV